MVKNAGEILALLFVGLALGFWVISMTTRGWLIIQVRNFDRYRRVPFEVSMNK